MAYSRAVFYVDLVNGSDAARAALAGCNMTSSGGVVTVNKTAHGLVDGAVVTVPTGTYSGDWLVKRTDADNFTLHTAPATGIIEVTGTPVADETFVIGSQTFTFKASRSGAGEVTISSDVEVQAKNIADAINTDINTVAQAFIGNYGYDEEFYHKVIVRSVVPGTTGNSLTFTENATGITVDGSGNLAGGTNSTYSADRSSVSITPKGGMNFVDAFKYQCNTGSWGDFQLIAKTPAPVSLGQNATFTNGSKTVTLTTKVTEVIENCESAWTCSANVTNSNNTTRRQGSYARNLAIGAAFTTGKVAYKEISELNLSGYQKICFYLYTSNVAIAASTLKICLCSDTAGDTPVDTLYIPVVKASWGWNTITINKGSALGASIKSIAIYADSDPGTITLTIDHIIACNAINLNTIIGKENTEDHGRWYAIQSIVDTTILIDSAFSTSTGGRGYSGNTETVTLYYINGHEPSVGSHRYDDYLSTAYGNGNSTNNTNLALQNKVLGGWNTTSKVQDGETWVSRGGFGRFINQTYGDTTMHHKLCCANSYSGVIQFVSGAHHMVIYKCSNINCVNNSDSGTLSGGYDNSFIVKSYKSLNNKFESIPYNSVIRDLIVENCDTGCKGGSSVSIGQYNLKVINGYFRNNGTYGIFIGGLDSKLINCQTLENSSYGVRSHGKLTAENLIINEVTEVSLDYFDSEIHSRSHDNTEGNNKMFASYVTITMQTSTKHADDPVAWKVEITNSLRNQFYPMKFKLLETYCPASESRTFTSRMKKDHATDIVCKLIAYTQNGVAIPVQTLKSSDTDWEDVSITFTPTVSRVYEIFMEIFYVSGNSNAYVGRMQIS